MSSIEDKIKHLEERMLIIDQKQIKADSDLIGIYKDIAAIRENYKFSELLIKFVVLPLVAILGSLVGIKVAFP